MAKTGISTNKGLFIPIEKEKDHRTTKKNQRIKDKPDTLDDNDMFCLSSCANSYIGDDATHL